MKRILNLLLFSFIVIQSGWSQEAPKLNDYPYFYSSNEFYSSFLLNPGYAGYNRQHEFQFSNLAPINGLNNSLNSYSLSYNGYFDKIHSGIGLSAYTETYGDFDKRHEISGFYNYQMVRSSKLNLTIGAKLGLSGRKIDNSEVDTGNGFLIGSGDWLNAPLVDLGLTFNYNKLTMGIAYKNLIENKIKSGTFESVLFSKGFIGNVAYEFAPTDRFIIKPYLIDYYYDQNSLSAGIMTDINNKILAGIGYETYYKKLNATLALRFLKHFQLGYIFEKAADYGYNGILLKVELKSGSQQTL